MGFLPANSKDINRYYIHFEFSLYTLLLVDCAKRTVKAVSTHEIDKTSVFVRPLDLYKLHEAKVYDSSSFRMVMCFFDRFYMTMGTMYVSEFSSPEQYMEEMRMSLYPPSVFSSITEEQESNPWRIVERDDGGVWVCEFAPSCDGLNPGPGGRTLGFTCSVRREIDGSLTLKQVDADPLLGPFVTNNNSTEAWRLVSVRRPHTTQDTI